MTTHCKYGAPCERHRAEAIAAADAAEQEFRRQAVERGLPMRHEAQMASGVRVSAYQRALERPLTPCSDGQPCEIGWPPMDDPE